ncbi:hypothetical protein CAPI_01495 [Corynebacterium capitovis DSM 44611]|uniref:DUF1707 SHOCT-like domain-containing protein n=1 Tax=Corynebacterium capitovis TaxID=131081 RepID=UPI00037FD5AE|nr:DUF1707 domain-containing protein [Corynebacterium capitovis]WKD56873.1 hypothetical protein CAPI_01495 [Corynebacterium capitovis DSM 44611]
MTGDEGHIRVGDAERSQALDRLGELFTDGYLTVTEFDERSAAAASASVRGELDQLFVDLPSQTTPSPADRSGLTHLDAEAELDRVLAKGRKVSAADAVVGSVATVVFFLGLFLGWDYFWVVVPLAGAACIGVRAFFQLEDEEEELYEELSKSERRERAERLRIAAMKRKELGH